MTIGVLDKDGNPQTVSTIDDLIAIVARESGLAALLVAVQALGGAAAGVDGSSTIATGGSAQSLFSGATPTNGFTVHNPDDTEDLWISLSTTAVANGTANINIAAGGGSYTTPPGMRPFHAISIVGATTGHKFTAIKW